MHRNRAPSPNIALIDLFREELRDPLAYHLILGRLPDNTNVLGVDEASWGGGAKALDLYFDLWDSHDRRRELSPPDSHNLSTCVCMPMRVCMPMHACMHAHTTHTHTSTHLIENQKQIKKSPNVVKLESYFVSEGV